MSIVFIDGSLKPASITAAAIYFNYDAPALYIRMPLAHITPNLIKQTFINEFAADADTCKFIRNADFRMMQPSSYFTEMIALIIGLHLIFRHANAQETVIVTDSESLFNRWNSTVIEFFHSAHSIGELSRLLHMRQIMYADYICIMIAYRRAIICKLIWTPAHTLRSFRTISTECQKKIKLEMPINYSDLQYIAAEWSVIMQVNHDVGFMYKVGNYIADLLVQHDEGSNLII